MPEHASWPSLPMCERVERAELYCNGSLGNIVIEQRHDLSCKGEEPSHRSVGRFSWQDSRGKTHKRAIAAIHTDRVRDKVDLGPVLAGDGAIVGPVPVEDQQAVGTFCDHIAIHGKG